MRVDNCSQYFLKSKEMYYTLTRVHWYLVDGDPTFSPNNGDCCARKDPFSLSFSMRAFWFLVALAGYSFSFVWQRSREIIKLPCKTSAGIKIKIKRIVLIKIKNLKW